jgi:hypothetical protein
MARRDIVRRQVSRRSILAGQPASVVCIDCLNTFAAKNMFCRRCADCKKLPYICKSCNHRVSEVKMCKVWDHPTCLGCWRSDIASCVRCASLSAASFHSGYTKDTTTAAVPTAATDAAPMFLVQPFVMPDLPISPGVLPGTPAAPAPASRPAINGWRFVDDPLRKPALFIPLPANQFNSLSIPLSPPPTRLSNPSPLFAPTSTTTAAAATLDETPFLIDRVACDDCSRLSGAQLCPRCVRRNALWMEDVLCPLS